MSGVPDWIGIHAVKLARSAITSSLLGSGRDLDLPSLRRGVFVTLYRYPTMELRGCVGYPYPVDDLKGAIVRAALMSAFEDPRFPPLTGEELNEVVVEVSLLTEPQLISFGGRIDLPKLIRIGVDGLIIESRYGSGLLLPQVPISYGWDVYEFLVNLCLKAGLSPTYWMEKEAKIFRFAADVFKEKEPNGEVVRDEGGV
ncbi:MAG: TIGR00296 family protein [Aigarchaeota archaeon]|nr:TIGR00296 family protein [Aigarchaeota archaeon]MDW8093001.1 TIGR00296 family protein [Nitrososphaerota archaeon]